MRVEEVAEDAFLARRLIVARLHPSGRCFFATDADSGSTVFVGRHAMHDAAEWDDVEIGFELTSDVEIDDNGRFNARSRSARIYP